MKSSEDLADWLSHLETLHPKSIDLGLTRITTVAERLGLRQGKPLTITVAGTNGKGSTVATLQHFLKRQGASVGAYTSPHLIDFNERIVVRGAPASDTQILAAFAEIEPLHHRHRRNRHRGFRFRFRDCIRYRHVLGRRRRRDAV